MQGEPEGRTANADILRIERAIVAQILCEDHERRWSRMELEEEIRDCKPLALEEALARLERDGVLLCEGQSVWAARGARRLDELELIGI